MQFQIVHMPGAVERELGALRDHKARSSLELALKEGWLIKMNLPDEAPFPEEMQGLDAGETEALRLALVLGADRVLMDEQEGRQRAAKLGIQTVGVLGVLLAAKKFGVILSLSAEINRLRAEAGFYIARSLEDQLITLAGE